MIVNKKSGKPVVSRSSNRMLYERFNQARDEYDRDLEKVKEALKNCVRGTQTAMCRDLGINPGWGSAVLGGAQISFLTLTAFRIWLTTYGQFYHDPGKEDIRV